MSEQENDNIQDMPPMDDDYLASLEESFENSDVPLEENLSPNGLDEIPIQETKNNISTPVEENTVVQTSVKEDNSSKPISIDELENIADNEKNASIIENDDAQRIGHNLETILYFDPIKNSDDISETEKAYLETYHNFLNNLNADDKIVQKDIISEATEAIILEKLLTQKFKIEEIEKAAKKYSPIDWNNKNLNEFIQEYKQKKQNISKDNEDFIREYINRLENIQYVLHQNKDYSPEEKAYLTMYHDLIANYDIETTPYKEFVNKKLEKDIATNLIEQGFDENKIANVIEKHSPLQLKAEEIEKLLHPNTNDKNQKDIEKRLETENLSTEKLCTDDDIKKIIKENNGNSVKVRNAIFIKAKTTYDAFIRLNRIRNFPRFISKLSDDPKYFYLQEASRLRKIQIQGRLLTNKAEIELYKKSNNDLFIATKLLENGQTKDVISSLIAKYSPLKPTTKEINFIMHNAEILNNMQKLAKINVEDTNIKNIADEYVLVVKQVMMDNLSKNKGILWNDECNAIVIKSLLNKGYVENKIIPVVSKLSPLPTSEDTVKKLISNINNNQNLSLKDFLSNKLKNSKFSDAKIIDDALKKDFPEVKDKKTLSKMRIFIQNELMQVKKQVQKMVR